MGARVHVLRVLGGAILVASACGAQTASVGVEPEPQGPPEPPPDAAPSPIRATLAGIPVGGLIGRVFDATSGRSLDLVRVKAIAPGLRGPRTDFTATDGRFFLNNLRVMPHDVVFALEGGPELTVTGVAIPQGEAARVCVKLGAQAQTIEWDGGARCDDPEFAVTAP